MIESRRYWVKERISLRSIAEAIMRLQVGPNSIAEIIIRPARREKTTNQRKLFHAICGDIGKELGETTGHVKDAIKADFYGVDSYVVAGRHYFSVQSTEESDREEYGRLIDYAYQWAAEREVIVPDRRPR